MREPADLLALAIEEANATFRNSGIGNVTLRLVPTQMIEYDETEDDQFTHFTRWSTALTHSATSDNYAMRSTPILSAGSSTTQRVCGLSTRIGPTSDEAFFVVHHACAAITMSIAHQIGHILGARHDHFADENDAPVAYGHGYVNDSKWRDIMSYNAGCGGCPRIPYWPPTMPG